MKAILLLFIRLLEEINRKRKKLFRYELTRAL